MNPSMPLAKLKTALSPLLPLTTSRSLRTRMYQGFKRVLNLLPRITSKQVARQPLAEDHLTLARAQESGDLNGATCFLKCADAIRQVGGLNERDNSAGSADIGVGSKPHVMAQPPVPRTHDNRLPPTGALIARTYMSQKLEFQIEHDNFTYDGQHNLTRSAAAGSAIRSTAAPGCPHTRAARGGWRR